MRSFLFLYLLVLLPHMSFSQEKEVAVSYALTKDSVVFYLKNNMQKQVEITLNLNVTNLRGHNNAPMTRVVAAADSVRLIMLAPVPNARWSYKYTYMRHYDGDKEAKAIDLLGTTKEEFDSSVLVFDKNGCSRCDRTLAYLDENKVPHHILNISADERNRDLMYQYLIEQGFNASVVTTPVIVIKGKVYYDIPNLSQFLKKIKIQ